MLKLINKQQGFTIVEFLIVIVIIGVLAMISIVAYNGISNMANDAAVKSDLANFAKRADIYKAEKGGYPPATTAGLDQIKVAMSHGSYRTDIYNVYYCTGSSAQNEFAIVAKSKSNKFFYASSRGSGELSSGSPQWQTSCGVIGLTVLADVQFSYAYNLSNGTWGTWAK